MTTEEILEKLNSKKSADRRRGAKEIGKLKLSDLGEELYEKYLIERLDKRTWETQCEMIKALGSIDFRKAINEIELIVRTNIPHDMITIVAGTTYIQLKRKSINDGSPVLELLDFGSVSALLHESGKSRSRVVLLKLQKNKRTTSTYGKGSNNGSNEQIS